MYQQLSHKKILLDLVKPFSPKYESWKVRRKKPEHSRQFAILCYRLNLFDANEVTDRQDEVFLENVTENFNHPWYCAAVPHKNPKPKMCTEIILLRSALNAMIEALALTEDAGNENIYLYTYYEPCPTCTTEILKFVNGRLFKCFIVGFTEPLSDKRINEENRAKARFDAYGDKVMLIDLGKDWYWKILLSFLV